MKKELQLKKGMVELTGAESATIIGGEDFRGYVKCVTTTLTSGGGGFKTACLGLGLFGLARIAGVMVGCRYA
jgi:hypothetical protein